MKLYTIRVFFLAQFALIFWEEEDSASVVKEKDILGDLVVGESSDVKIGKKVYKGKVSAIGSLFTFNNNNY